MGELVRGFTVSTFALLDNSLMSVDHQPFLKRVNVRTGTLKDKSGVDKIIVKKQSYQLLNTSREFFPSF